MIFVREEIIMKFLTPRKNAKFPTIQIILEAYKRFGSEAKDRLRRCYFFTAFFFYIKEISLVFSGEN